MIYSDLLVSNSGMVFHSKRRWIKECFVLYSKQIKNKNEFYWPIFKIVYSLFFVIFSVLFASRQSDNFERCAQSSYTGQILYGKKLYSNFLTTIFNTKGCFYNCYFTICFRVSFVFIVPCFALNPSLNIFNMYVSDTFIISCKHFEIKYANAQNKTYFLMLFVLYKLLNFTIFHVPIKNLL